MVSMLRRVASIVLLMCILLLADVDADAEPLIVAESTITAGANGTIVLDMVTRSGQGTSITEVVLDLTEILSLGALYDGLKLPANRWSPLEVPFGNLCIVQARLQERPKLDVNKLFVLEYTFDSDTWGIQVVLQPSIRKASISQRLWDWLEPARVTMRASNISFMDNKTGREYSLNLPGPSENSLSFLAHISHEYLTLLQTNVGSVLLIMPLKHWRAEHLPLNIAKQSLLLVFRDPSTQQITQETDVPLVFNEKNQTDSYWATTNTQLLLALRDLRERTGFKEPTPAAELRFSVDVSAIAYNSHQIMIPSALVGPVTGKLAGVNIRSASDPQVLRSAVIDDLSQATKRVPIAQCAQRCFGEYWIAAADEAPSRVASPMWQFQANGPAVCNQNGWIATADTQSFEEKDQHRPKSSAAVEIVACHKGDYPVVRRAQFSNFQNPACSDAELPDESVIKQRHSLTSPGRTSTVIKDGVEVRDSWQYLAKLAASCVESFNAHIVWSP